MIGLLKGANLALAFLLELAMLAAFAYAGWQITPLTLVRIVLAVGLPLLAIVLWALWAAPRAGKTKLKQPWRSVFQIAIFGAAAIGLWLVGQGGLAAIFAALVAINISAALVFKQE